MVVGCFDDLGRFRDVSAIGPTVQWKKVYNIANL